MSRRLYFFPTEDTRPSIASTVQELNRNGMILVPDHGSETEFVFFDSDRKRVVFEECDGHLVSAFFEPDMLSLFEDEDFALSAFRSIGWISERDEAVDD